MADGKMTSHTSTLPCSSSERQQVILSHLVSSTFKASDAPSSSFDFNNANDRSNNAAFVSPKSSTPLNSCLQNDLHQTIHRRGSLPLKKRRVFMLQDDLPYPMPFQRVDGSGFRTIDSFLQQSKVEDGDDKPALLQRSSYDVYRWDQDSLNRNPMNGSPFDKMNTLSLIAAAAAVNEASQTSQYAIRPNTSRFNSSLSSFNRVDPMRNPNTTFATSFHGDSADDFSESTRTNSLTSSNGNDTHGAESSPDFNNVDSAAFHDEQTTKSYKNSNKSSKGESSLQECPSNCSVGQDKRYTGLSPHQVRCNAVTTRGRPCTYAAVQSTTYCFLHADYDTNPPPRRLKSSNDEEMETSSPSSMSPATMIVREDEVSEDEVEDQISCSQAVFTKSTMNNKSKVPVPTVTGFKKRRTNAKFAEKHAESTRPLLSMMATDQWFGQSVQIAVGPFEGHSGKVQKWGNGWITVLIEGVGFHNRRSFELYLDTDGIDDNDMNIEEAKSGGKKNKKKSGKKLKDRDRQLFRCVSRDVVSPSPPVMDAEHSKRSISNGVAKKSRSVTPKPSSTMDSRHKKSSPNLKKLTTIAEIPETLQPRCISDGTETPVPVNSTLEGISSMKTLTATTIAEIPETLQHRCISDGAETPVPVKSTLEGISSMKTLSLPTPKVTPFPEKATTVTHSLTVQDRANFDLHFPGHSDDETKQSNGLKSFDSSLVFRPSMGERTRGRSSNSNLAGSRNNSRSSDSMDSSQSVGKTTSNQTAECTMKQSSACISNSATTHDACDQDEKMIN